MKKNEASLTFVTFAPGTLAFPANKAYLKVPEGNFTDGARLAVSFEDEDVTGINEAKSQKPMANGQYFDLQGRKVAQPTRGLYIVHGRKVLVK